MCLPALAVLTSRVRLLSSPAQTEGEPTVRIGNWVEQRALLSTTGHARGALVTDPETGCILPVQSQARTVQHLPAARMDWRSETVRSWEEGLQGSRREGEVQQSRRQLREQQLWQRAAQQAEEAERLKRAEEEKELHHSLYGHRQPVNRRRALGDGQGGGLEQAAITLHNTATMGGLRPEKAAQRGECLHHRNTAFSVPIQHSKGGAHHQHGI